MFKFMFVCADKDEILFHINQIIMNDLPCGKSIFGNDLYKSGIHFQECDDKIKGFYIAESENESHKGSPIRVCFTGKFIDDTENLFFGVHIYPRVMEFLLLIFAFLFLSITGKVIGFIIAAVVLSFFIKGYYDMMKETYHILNRIFN